MSRSLQFILFVFIQYLSLSVFAVDFSGVVELTEKGKPADKREYQDIVIYFIPDEPIVNANDSLIIEAKEMKMEKKNFSPRVLSIQTGTTVNFPNFDPIIHNAFSTSAKNKFDLGLYGGGEEKSYTFDKPGLVRIYCNVHHNMVAYILVFDFPYFTSLDSNDEFTLKDLPADSGQIVLWHPRAKAVKQKLDLTTNVANQEFEIKLTKRRIPKHKNKLGKSYRKTKQRAY